MFKYSHKSALFGVFMQTLFILVVCSLFANYQSVDAQRCGIPCGARNEPYMPVCDNQGDGYASIKAFECARRCNPALLIDYYGECHNNIVKIEFIQAVDEDGCKRCSSAGFPYAPVCDNYGTGYNTYQQFKCAQICDPSLKVAHYGECRQWER